MNKIAALFTVAIIALGGGGLVLLAQKDKKADQTNSAKTSSSQNTQTATPKTSSAYPAVKACDVLTLDAAKKIIGVNAKKADTSIYDSESDDILVSQCLYTFRPDTGNPATDSSHSLGVSILARIARTKTGADDNKNQFGSKKPAGVKDVTGIGDKAYFDATMGQLDVLKGGNWYILSNYTGTPKNSTVDSTTKLYKAVKLK